MKPLEDIRDRVTNWEFVIGLIFTLAALYWWAFPEHVYGRVGPVLLLVFGLRWIIVNPYRKRANDEGKTDRYRHLRVSAWPLIVLFSLMALQGKTPEVDSEPVGPGVEIQASELCHPCATSEFGQRFIQRFEGFSPVVYRDAAGYWTIGHGILLTDEEFERFRGRAITAAEADSLFSSRLASHADAVNRLVTRDLWQWEFDALVSFGYNVGSGALQRSTLLRLVNDGEIERAASEFERWVFAGEKRLRGLERRREAEARMYQLAATIYSEHDAQRAMLAALMP